MSSIQQEIDERTNLTASNKFELLLFRLGIAKQTSHSELFGINVFKVREIVAMPSITEVAGAVENNLDCHTAWRRAAQVRHLGNPNIYPDM